MGKFDFGPLGLGAYRWRFGASGLGTGQGFPVGTVLWGKLCPKINAKLAPCLNKGTTICILI